ncbi:MAG: 2-oxoglutarate dehydrogenase E1 component [Pseudomonadota bacterium]
MHEGMKAWFDSSQFAGANAAYLEEIYEQYLINPNQVDSDWKNLFDQLPKHATGNGADVLHSEIRDYFRQLAIDTRRGRMNLDGAAEYDAKQDKVTDLIIAYRVHGHQHASLDPLGLWNQLRVPQLSLDYYDLTERDMTRRFKTGFINGPKDLSLAEIHKKMIETYCGSVGVEYMHIMNTEETMWLQERIERNNAKENFTKEEKVRTLYGLVAAEGLEKYCGAKFPGAKRFSLEGGDSLVPMLDNLVQRSGAQGAREIVIGMAHRGRLNVLINLLGKRTEELFDEFAGKHTDVYGSGDVKYHQGFSSDIKTPGGVVHLALAFNPSHLEIVSPVVEGSCRARLERRQDESMKSVLPVIIHGDAAFTGQGVVMETFNMSQTNAYKTGGTVHIVINNQVGFTTNKQEDARSTVYCTDVAKMVQAPIFHVNSDDPEAVLFVTQLALDYRNKFHKDVVIDLVCYRRHGHNEADEPKATQPLMYSKIRNHPTTYRLYADTLIARGIIEKGQTKKMIEDYRAALDKGDKVVNDWLPMEQHKFTVDWKPYLHQDWDAPAATGISREKLLHLGEKVVSVPESFTLNSRVKKIVGDRQKMLNEEQPIDWGCAELLSYAALLSDGFPIRISGQDSGRGTFFHRHAVWHDQNTGDTHITLKNLGGEQAEFNVYDSVLSEEAVLAFEYGYSTTEPRALVIWEAQFGDFANGAQVVIDQFISSGEHKWGRLSGLVMFLPHGYEGQGPEHSSARLERYLQLCAEHNIQVCVPTTPAQVFHMIRRQMIRQMRRPLVVMTPKSLLRHKMAVSAMDELINGEFRPVIEEVDSSIAPQEVTRVILCSGKVYYELVEKRSELGLNHVAILRIEQLYPFPTEILTEMLKAYAHVQEFVWCQEEPMNQGAWYSSQHNFNHCLPSDLRVHFAGREASASPAAGYMALHLKEQEQLIADALGITNE